jgi:hypothetical protein
MIVIIPAHIQPSLRLVRGLFELLLKREEMKIGKGKDKRTDIKTSYIPTSDGTLHNRKSEGSCDEESKG